MLELVSIIMPVYNAQRFVSESIESVLSQTYNNWELLIIDDASIDGTQEAVKTFVKKYPNIYYEKLEKNSGVAIARNRALEKSKGTYIAFLDSDDLWAPEKLEKQINFMTKNNYFFTYSKYKVINESGIFTGRKWDSVEAVDYRRLLRHNYIGNSSVIYNCAELGKIYTPDIRKRNDYALWLQILKKVQYAYRIDDYLMYYRQVSNSLSRNKFKLVRYQWELYRKIEKLSYAESLVYLINNIILKLFRIKC